MRALRFLPVLIALPIFLSVVGCQTVEPTTSSIDAKEQSEAPGPDGDEPSSFPGFYVGTYQPKHRVAYIWSHDCHACRDQFTTDVLRLYLSAISDKKTVFALLEYEANQNTIRDFTAPALCGGKEFYQWYALGFLVNGLTMQQTRHLASKKGAPYKNCADRKVINEILAPYFATMKQDHPEISTAAGTLVLDGKVVTSVKEIEDAVSR